MSDRLKNKIAIVTGAQAEELARSVPDEENARTASREAHASRRYGE
jgi:hypothetical protein